LPEAVFTPVAPFADPVVRDPDAVPSSDAEGDDTDGKEEVGTLRGSDPTTLPLLFV
jgi:hypothetical protein